MLRDKMMSFQKKKQFALRIKHQALADAVILDRCSRRYILLTRWSAMTFYWQDDLLSYRNYKYNFLIQLSIFLNKFI